ncbi:MAG: hypothetical protein WAK17_10985 [Candidatus Nitrosopolaris sp.]
MLLICSAMTAYAHTAAYIEGFNGGLAHNQNTCSDIPYNGSNTEKRDECIAGVINNTESYRVGLKGGYIDHLISSPSRAVFDSNDTCKGFTVNESDCQQGYNTRWQKPINSIDERQAIATNKQTLAYRTGFFIGAHDKSLSKYHSACQGFGSRDTLICENAYDDGYLTISWNYHKIFELGYKYGKSAVKMLLQIEQVIAAFS